MAEGLLAEGLKIGLEGALGGGGGTGGATRYVEGPDISRVVLGLEGAEDQRFSGKLALGRGCGGCGGD